MQYGYIFAFNVLFCCLMLAVISYLTALSTALKSGTYDDCISSFSSLPARWRHSILLPFIWGETKAEKKQAIKGYFLKLIGTLLVLSGSLCHESILFPFFSHGQNGWPLLLGSGLLTVIVILVCVVLYRRLKGLPVSLRLFSSKDIKPPRRKRLSWPSPQSQTRSRGILHFLSSMREKAPSDSTFAAPAAQSSKCKRCLSMPKKYREPLPARW